MSVEAFAPPPGGALAVERPTRPVRTESSVEWLVDNAEAYDSLVSAIRGARRSVWIAQLALDADCVAYAHLADDDAARDDSPAGVVLARVLLEATTTPRPLDVRVLLNTSLLLDTAKPLRRFLAAAGADPARFRVRGISRFPQLLHAKVVVVDGAEAFLVGSPFANGYWDDSHHRPTDARRPPRELGGRPLHDLSVRVTGPAASDLATLYAELWNEAAVAVEGDDERLRATRAAPDETRSPGAIRVVRTLPRRVLPALPDGATEVLDACLEGISRARSLIYVEHQYLSARPVVAALAAALERSSALEVVIVLNQNPDITAYRAWQNARLAEHRLLGHPRVGVFALWSADCSAERPGVTAVNQLFVHSKVLTVDDEWATVGSANLDGVSLHSYGDDFDRPLARRIFRDVRNFDVNLVVDDGERDDGAAGDSVADLRVRLWTEHLALPAGELRRRPAGGWLPLWRECAARNVAALSSPPPRAGRVMRGFVLPYSTRPTPRRQLADVGVRADAPWLDVRFDPGWLEVHFSPNWVRNMFL